MMTRRALGIPYRRAMLESSPLKRFERTLRAVPSQVGRGPCVTLTRSSHEFLLQIFHTALRVLVVCMAVFVRGISAEKKDFVRIIP